jgi:hypothetical protein
MWDPKAIDPAYDVETKTWFIEKPIVAEAPTIRQLLAMINARKMKRPYHVINYYPLGYGAQLATKAMDEAITPPLKPEPQLKRERVVKEKKPEPTIKSNKKKWKTTHRHIYEEVMDLWALGIDGKQIADTINQKHGADTVNRITVSSHIVEWARTQHDPRAIRHKTRPPVPSTQSNQVALPSEQSCEANVSIAADRLDGGVVGIDPHLGQSEDVAGHGVSMDVVE